VNRLNRQPIFIEALAGSGSNLLWNILQSHPGVCSPVWETHELFQRGLAGKLDGALFTLFGARPGYMARPDPAGRAPLPRAAAAHLDLCLFRGKLRTLCQEDNVYRAPGQRYSPGQVRAARLAAKNLDGLVQAAPALARVFPDACFVGILRNGLALCESALRRGTATSAHAFARRYVTLTRRMQQSSRDLPRHTLVRFEELLAQPRRFAARVYRAAGLDLSPDQPVRLKARTHYTAPGVRGSSGTEGEKEWMSLSALPRFLQPDVDRLQAAQLSPGDRDAFLAVAGELMEELGYLHGAVRGQAR